MAEVFLRPFRGSLPFLPLFPVDESLGHDLSPSGLGRSGREQFLLNFWFLHNIPSSTNVYKRGTAARGGGAEMLRRTNETSRPCTNKPNWQWGDLRGKSCMGKAVW